VQPAGADLINSGVLAGERPAAPADTAGSSSPAEADDEVYCPVVIRKKVFGADPMTVDDALYHMELVGHDFFLFIDSESGRPSVVYRRKGWDYGVIALDENATAFAELSAETVGAAGR
jgi:hypothetical protein